MDLYPAHFHIIFVLYFSISPLPSFHLLTLLRKSPSLCCWGFNLLSLHIPFISSPHFTTNRSIHSRSPWLCILGRHFLPPWAAAASSCGTMPPLPPSLCALLSPVMPLSSSLSDKSFKASPSGLGLVFRPSWECSTRTMAPVSGSRVIFAVVGVMVLGVREEMMVRGSGFDSFREVEVERVFDPASVPPARALSLEVRPRRR